MDKEKFETIITHESIKNQIDKNIRNGFQAIHEYIWNSIDAGANEIEVNFKLSNDLTKDLFSKAEIKDNGKGIDFNKFTNKKFLTFNDSEKEKNPHKSLPHGHRGYGRFSFIRICNDIEWKSTYLDKSNKFKSYKILMNSKNLLNIKTDNLNNNITSNTCTTVSFFNFINPNDLIKENDINALIESIKLEFAWIIELLGLNFKINGKKLEYKNLFQKPKIVERKNILNNNFDITLIFWNTKLTNQDSRFYFIDSKGKEKFTKNIIIPKIENLNISLYVKSDFFNEYKSYLLTNKKEETLFEAEKTYKQLLIFLEKYLISKSSDLKESIINQKYNDIINKDYFKEMFVEGVETNLKKPLIEKLTKKIIRFDEGILKNKNDKQNKIILNLISNSLESDDARDSLIRILKLLLNEDNKKDLEDLENELRKYKLGNILAVTKEINKRFKALKYFEKIINDKDFYYYESDLQKRIEKHFWIFGEQYHMVGAENDKFKKLLQIYYENVLHLNKEEIKEVLCSKKEVDLMISRKDPSFGESIVNTIVEIKRPGSESNLKEKNLTQIKGYAKDISNIKEFNSNSEEWNFILVGSDYNDEVKYEIKNKSSLKEGLLLDKPEINQKIYVKKWADIIRDARYRMEYLKKKLELEERQIAEEVEKEISKAKGDRQVFLDNITKEEKDE